MPTSSPLNTNDIVRLNFDHPVGSRVLTSGAYYRYHPDDDLVVVEIGVWSHCGLCGVTDHGYISVERLGDRLPGNYCMLAFRKVGQPAAGCDHITYPRCICADSQPMFILAT